MLAKTWFVLAGCCALASSQLISGFKLRAMHVERNWVVSPSAPFGTLVTKVDIERTGNENVTFSLETTGPPTPFQIDPRTGVVTVNDTLIDKENLSYFLWVKADDGYLPQRTEVYTTVKDLGSRPKISHPPYPYPIFKLLYPSPLPTKIERSTHRTTGLTEEYVPEVTVPEKTTTTTPKTPDDIPEVDKVDNNDKNKSSVTHEASIPSNDVLLTAIPLIAIGGLVVIVAAVIVFVWKKNNSQRLGNTKKNDKLSEETTITKQVPPAEWEFPRHRLRIFNIVGQLWRAQAFDIDGKKGEQTVAVKTLK